MNNLLQNCMWIVGRQKYPELVKADRQIPVQWHRWWTGILLLVASETDGCGSLQDSQGGSVPVLEMDVKKGIINTYSIIDCAKSYSQLD